jgi:2-dehydro-3-deoxyphosphooctonate aldolase (KDO 8-P synthase)
MTASVIIGDSLTVGGGAPLALIAGPCVIESEAHCLALGEKLKTIAAACGFPLIFKASFDKANRTSVRSYRGPGLEKGLQVLLRVKRELGLPVLSDIHEPIQAAPAAEVLDVLQIPAFLCRQTDLLLAAARTGRAVNVKKGQFLAPEDVGAIVEKIRSTGNTRLLLTERGTSFGYRNLVVDMRSLVILRSLGTPVVFDATHSVQIPGGEGERSGGTPELIEPLARAATAVGIDALFVEVHDDPARALSDASSALPLARLEALLRRVRAIDAASRPRSPGGSGE